MGDDKVDEFGDYSKFGDDYNMTQRMTADFLRVTYQAFRRGKSQGLYSFQTHRIEGSKIIYYKLGDLRKALKPVEKE